MKLIEMIKKEKPVEGDFVEYKCGKLARISIIREETIQLSNKIGVFVSLPGNSESSGCTWDPEVEVDKTISISDLLKTSSTKKGRCWTFSQNLPGKDRGVYFEIYFKVWKLKGLPC